MARTRSDTNQSGIGHDQNGNAPIGDDNGGSVDIAANIDGIPLIAPDQFDTGDSGAATGDGGNGGSGKRRGRKPGSKNTNANETKTKNSVNGAEGIATILYSLHLMAAKFIPEMELDEAESKELGVAVERVASFYDIVPDPKILAWVGLIGVAGKLYVPRFTAMQLRVRIKQKQREAARHAPPPPPRQAEPPKPAPTPAYDAAVEIASFIGETDFSVAGMD